jgi:hypothetical protein
MLPDNDGPELFQAFRAETDAALVGISAKSSVSGHPPAPRQR